jgi:hypothetical protein
VAPLQEGGGSPEPSPAASERLAQPGVVTAEAIVAALELKEKRDAENEERERARAARRQAEEEEEISECVAGGIAYTRRRIRKIRRGALWSALASITYFAILLLIPDVAWWAYIILVPMVAFVWQLMEEMSNENKALRELIKAQGNPEIERAIYEEWFPEGKPSDFEWPE